MFYSSYLPVNIGRKNEFVYTDTEHYPVELLTLAKEALVTNTTCNGKVIVDNGLVTFTEHDEISWSIPSVYLAWEAYECAVKNKFSFYMVCNNEGIPQLFVSKEFRKSRILVSAFSFKSVLVKNVKMLKKISGMIDHKYSNMFCMNLFDVISKVESGYNRFLDAIIVNRDTVDQSMVVNPILTLYSEVTVDYLGELIEEFRQIINDETEQTESLSKIGNAIQRHDLSYWPAMSMDFCKDLVDTYDRMLAKKNNYIPLNGGDYEPYLYVSTNWRYLVNASTLECLIIKNSYLKNLVQCYAAQDTSSIADLNMCWSLALTDR